MKFLPQLRFRKESLWKTGRRLHVERLHADRTRSSENERVKPHGKRTTLTATQRGQRQRYTEELQQRKSCSLVRGSVTRVRPRRHAHQTHDALEGVRAPLAPPGGPGSRERGTSAGGFSAREPARRLRRRWWWLRFALRRRKQRTAQQRRGPRARKGACHPSDAGSGRTPTYLNARETTHDCDARKVRR